MSRNLKNPILFTSFSAALLLCGCNVVEEGNPPPLPSSGSSYTASATDNGDDTGQTSGVTAADATGGGESSGSAETGGNTCEPTVSQYACNGRLAVGYVKPDNSDVVITRVIGDPNPPLWCALPPTGNTAGVAKSMELHACGQTGAGTDEREEFCQEEAAKLTPADLDRPDSVQVDQGDGLKTWQGQVFYSGWNSNSDFPLNTNTLEGGCTTNGGANAVPLLDKFYIPLPCSADMCSMEELELEDCSLYDTSDVHSAYNRYYGRVRASMPLEIFDALRGDVGRANACDGGLYTYHVTPDGTDIGAEFGSLDSSTLFGKLGFRRGDQILSVEVDIDEKPVKMPLEKAAEGVVTFFLLQEEFPPGSHMSVVFTVKNGSRTREIEVNTY